ncbi:MAG: zinc-dependent metalloprotease [Planctomycetes bacterium]|nr:zinc-dependent metalloprotease [Planctomycetota bacterium]
MPRLSALICVMLMLLMAVPVSAQRRGGRGNFRDRGDREDTEKNDKKKKEKIKPYDEVITEKATTEKGLFIVHRLEDKVFFEIPPAALGTELLWVSQIERTQSGFGYGGTSVGRRVVRWELRDKNVLLRDVKYRIRADVKDSVRNSVEATSLEPIIRTFAVKAWGKDKAAVIDVTGLFTSDIPEFSAKRRLNASGVDSKRTFIEKIKTFPTNIETKVLVTYKLSSGNTGRDGTTTPTPRRRRPRRGPRRDPSQGAVTVLMHHSMVKLPDVPMQARRFDDRVGFFNVSFEDYADQERHQVEQVRYITRWRLEKKDPSADVSEPIKPIVFYVGRGVPGKWRPWVHKGIEAWQPAFEAAGFKNAILAKDAPTKREDPDWDPEDARYSSIRWLPSTTENAMGPHVHDPRTGEILESDIIVYHNILKLVRDWYFVQASPNDERAQKLPMPDELIGELLAYVIAHEVGHSLGFPHNMKASSSYTVAQLRDPEFTKKNGTEASIMDYGRFNYVAQPGDGAHLIPVVGPYDFFAVEWGYGQFRSAKAESEGLREIVARQLDNPMLRFGNPNPGEDPSQQTEDLGSDPIAATTMGLQNIKRVADNLVNATCKEGENYDLLRNMYDQLLRQWGRETGHVANVVGGMVRNNVWFGDGDRVYDPVGADKQREAVEFINQNVFVTPEEFTRDDITQRLETNGAADRIVSAQKRVMRSLINESRIKRMAECATRSPDDAYLPVSLLEDVRVGIWTELESYPVAINLYRRNLQRAHVAMLTTFVKTDTPSSDLPALARGELVGIVERIDSSENKEMDRTTRLHLNDVRVRIQQILDPRKEKTVESGPQAAARTPGS